MTAINLIIFAVLIALTAFFVATEFAIVKVRTTKIDQLVLEGKKGAVSAKKVVTHLDEYLSACQLGITVTALGIGWVGEATFEVILHPIFAYFNVSEQVTHILILVIAFILATFLHVVVGELAPKTLAIQKAEAITLLTAKPIRLFYRVLYPFIWFLNGSARVLVGLFGLKPAAEHELAHSEEELRILLSESYKSGEINKNELKYVNNIFEFDERIAKEIMVPRTEIVTISLDDSYEDIIKTIKTEGYTRYPVVNGDKDTVRGFINAREFLSAYIDEDKKAKEEFKIEKHINSVIHVIESVPIHDLLTKMQKERIHIAILLDEYGGTSGLVTVEDILEEIVGEIRDEFDVDEIPDIRKLKDGHFIINSKLLIEDVNDLLDINLSHEEVDTIGGWFMTQNMDAEVGSELEADGYIFKVQKIDGRQIHFLEVKREKNSNQ
ncbi:hemolysin family protein [Bacillus swezeyi]|uniref:HlyC/CorC family transporter n=1 Tax=Bacillus swezeyi TaxID=1925020 RepID=A0A5M8RNC4_9BACI|nr:hemolysin family protein [Bacillus swezeyi]KAA6449371.1 HlyC/CorC family transporter [Bacillus swezeyi]KAA6474142.1 HlyC/CorC family transporter [Bacillus swezeyi]TYS33388.1 HlyC/CorC family transporter [Bacillus swezeyi]